MKRIIVGLTVIVLWSFHPSALAKSTGDVETAGELPASGKPEFFLSKHLEVGLRYIYFWLTDDSRPSDNSDNFLGSINKLEEDQNGVPYPFINYMFTKYVGLSMSYDELQVKTITKEDGHTDGSYELKGPVLSILCRYCNSSHFTPYAEAGIAFYNGGFNHDPAWRHVGNDRRMEIDDTEGYLLTIGCSVVFSQNWSMDIFCRYEDVEVNDKYFLNGNLREEQTIPLSNTGLGGSVKYVF